jgi:hypothetical protein
MASNKRKHSAHATTDPPAAGPVPMDTGAGGASLPAGPAAAAAVGAPPPSQQQQPNAKRPRVNPSGGAAGAAASSSAASAAPGAASSSAACGKRKGGDPTAGALRVRCLPHSSQLIDALRGHRSGRWRACGGGARAVLSSSAVRPQRSEDRREAAAAARSVGRAGGVAARGGPVRCRVLSD